MVRIARIVIIVSATLLLFMAILAAGWWAFAAVIATIGYSLAAVLDPDKS